MPQTRPQPVPESLLRSLLSAGSVVVLSGSGMSAESGIPTFRDALTGMWSRFRPEELATPAAFAADPARVWQWYQSRREQVGLAVPHSGYRALARMEPMLRRMTIVTQNVDGLHQRSGAGKVLELHGNILRSACSRTGRVIDDEWIRNADDIPPRSPYCDDGLARPDVVWFGEALPHEVLNEAISVTGACDLCFAIGTSAVVEPAASLPLLAKASGAVLVEINPRSTPLSPHADFCFRQPAGAALEALAGALETSASA